MYLSVCVSVFIDCNDMLFVNCRHRLDQLGWLACQRTTEKQSSASRVSSLVQLSHAAQKGETSSSMYVRVWCSSHLCLDTDSKKNVPLWITCWSMNWLFHAGRLPVDSLPHPAVAHIEPLLCHLAQCLDALLASDSLLKEDLEEVSCLSC